MVVIRLEHRARRQPNASFLPPHGVRQQPDVVRRSPSDSFLPPNAVRRQPDVIRRSTSDSFRAVWGARSAYNEAMRKRRWWFAGLALALLAACLGVMRWLERPPYSFMKDARLWRVVPHDGKGDFRVVYVVETPLHKLVADATAEMGLPARLDPLPDDKQKARAWVWNRWNRGGGYIYINEVNRDPHSKQPYDPRISPSHTASVTIYRKPTVTDQVFAWWYSLGGP